MSLNFLSPIFLFGLLGIAIPILIHLMTRRQKKRIRFSAVYLLFQSQKRSVKKAAPNRLLLLLIRCRRQLASQASGDMPRIAGIIVRMDSAMMPSWP